ncbi:MAG: DUF1330 domain-containing protein [Steroidobacteraceae bacterium]
MKSWQLRTGLPRTALTDGEIGEEWPDRETVLEFWNSAEYAEVRKLREGIADCRVVVVDSETPL